MTLAEPNNNVNNSGGATKAQASTKVPSKDPKKKEEKKDEDISEEDLTLKQQLELYVERVQDSDLGLQRVAFESTRVRAHMEENEQLAILMRGLRGQNLKDSLFANDNIKLHLVEVDENSEFLLLVYDPDSIAAYWGKRPHAIATRVVQLMSVAGDFLSRLAWDLINNKLKENMVARANELREIVTFLGPAYIKLGQALSIRPDTSPLIRPDICALPCWKHITSRKEKKE